MNIAAFQCYREHAGVKYEGNFVTERTREQLLKDYEGWEEEVTQLLQVCYDFFIYLHYGLVLIICPCL